MPVDSSSSAPGAIQGSRRGTASFAGASSPGATWGEAVALSLGAALLAAGVASLALAQLGWLRPSVLGAVLAAMALATVAGLAAAGYRPPRVDARESLAILGVIAGCAMLYFPGFPYAVADKDPGVYVNHAQLIAREHSASFADPIVERAAELDGALPIGSRTPGARFSGFWVDPDDPTVITPQFYHLLPSLMAAAIQVTGRTAAAFHLNTAIATVGSILLLFATRRVFGWTAGAVATALLCTNMMQVWQAKMPTTEVLFQALVLLAALAATVSLAAEGPPASARPDGTDPDGTDTDGTEGEHPHAATRGWATAATAGLAMGASFLVRPDGLLTVLMTVGGLAVVTTLHRADRRTAAFAAGFAATAGYGLFNAYGVVERYTVTNDVPGLRTVVALVAVVGLGTVLGRVVHGRYRSPIDRLLSDRRIQLAAGSHLTLLYLAAMLALYFRGSLFGAAELDYNGRIIRSLDEINLVRLSWFFSSAGLALAALGLIIVVARPWRPGPWLLLVPGLATFPLYSWEAKISPRLMWWTRRYVPLVILVIVVLIGVAVAWGIHRRGRSRPLFAAAAAGLTIYLVVFGLNQSWPLREHREWAGTFDFSRQVVETAAPDGGLFIWTFPTGTDLYQPARVLPTTSWALHDRLTTYIGANDDPAGFVNAYASAFPDEEVFVVTNGPDHPVGLDPNRLRFVGHLELVSTVWEETWNPAEPHRPRRAIPVPLDVSVWEFDRGPAS